MGEGVALAAGQVPRLAADRGAAAGWLPPEEVADGIALVDENAFRVDMPSVHDGYGAARTVTGG